MSELRNSIPAAARPRIAIVGLLALSLITAAGCDSTGGGSTAATAPRERNAPPPPVKVGPDVLARLDSRMAAIPAGAAKSASRRGEKPTRISAFRLGKFEVTRGEWRAVMKGESGAFAGDDLPVTGVSFLDVRRFLDRLNDAAGAVVYRLPTRREWEYACHAGRPGKYPWGNDESAISRHAWWGKNSDDQAHPVGQKPANAWGLHDMVGNVNEWTSDPMRPDLRYIEGGSYAELNDSGMLCENEAGMGEDGRDDYTGFRLVKAGAPAK